MQPLTITVHNKTENLKKTVSSSYFQTVGFLRKKIAEAFNYQINEFIMWHKNQLVDADEEDDKYFKDIGFMQTVVI